MSKWGAVDLRNMQKLQKRMKQLSKADLDAFCRDAAKELASRLLAKVKRRTPVDTGFLRNAWNIDADITKVGDEYEVVVINPTEYASYVNFGHRTKSGGWVKGSFFVTESEIELENEAPKILEKKLEKLLQETLLK